MDIFTSIYLWGFGVFCGHIMAGFLYSDFMQHIVDKIESKIKNYFDEKRKKKKKEKQEKEFNRILNNVYLRRIK